MRPLPAFPPSRSRAYDGRWLGLAFGWAGWACVWFHLREAGQVQDDPRVRRSILNLLRREAASEPRSTAISLYIGHGGAPMLAALAARTDPSFREVVPTLIARWSQIAKISRQTDLMGGAAGALVACRLIDGSLPGAVPKTFRSSLHRKTVRGLRTLLMQAVRAPVKLGLAHGIAGYLLALELAEARMGLPLEPRLRSGGLRLLALERVALRGGGAAWPHWSSSAAARPSHQSWCNGGPGIALCLLCGQTWKGGARYRKLAQAALTGIGRSPSRNGTFCCGSAGSAQILIEAFRKTGEARWLAQAKRIAEQGGGVDRRWHPHSFHHGRLGRSYLRWRLAHPKRLPMLGLEDAGRPIGS